MYVLSGVDHRWVGCRLVSRKAPERQRIRSVHGHCHGHLRSGGGRDAHAICRLWGIRGNHYYDSRCHDLCSPSDAACGYRERQKDVCPAALSVKWVWRIQVSSMNRTKTVFIREGTRLPKTLAIESESFLPGCKVVKILDRQP